MSKRFYYTILTVALLGCLLWIGASEPGNMPRQREASRILPSPKAEFPTIVLPEGFTIEKVVDGLTFPTSLAWDDQGQLYVAEAGGGLNPEQLAPSRILRIENGTATEVVNLTDKGVFASVVGLTWHEGAFFITHRDPADLTGAVSRVTPDGQVTQLFSGILDSQSEHQINDIQVGPDGRMYVAVGPTGNAGVVDESIAPWVVESPDVHTTPCQDIVLLGKNFKSADFRTEVEGDSVLTGAYVPFATETEPGQVIPGTNKCGGSILVFDPDDAEATVDWYAWGFRNLIGLAWDSQTGDMYAAENGYDNRGVRPVNDEFDASLRIQQGLWYGVPDFSAAREPLTDDKFEAPDSLQAEIFIEGVSIGKDLGFLIDHAASGLTPPDPSLVLGLHEINSSPSLLDVAPASWGDLAGHVFIAEWGDLAPPTNPLRGEVPAGSRVVRVDPATGQVEPFARNQQPGPASMQDALGEGIEHPFDVKFGADGAMYIVDYGVVLIDVSLEEQGKPPYRYIEGTGVIWKVSQQPAEDTTPPECEIMAVNPGPPMRLDIRVQDTGSGLASIEVLKDQNASVTWLAFAAGTPDPVIVHAEKQDQDQRASVVLRVTDVAENATTCDPVVTTVSAEVPEVFSLEQNYPNPFNPSTTIQFKLAEEGQVVLAIYDMIGRRVASLVEGVMQPGVYEAVWDGTNDAGMPVAGGVYVYHLKAGTFEDSKTMTLLK